MPVNAFTDFLNKGHILDEYLKLSDIDILFYTTNAAIVKAAYNPDRALVRYQFLEIIVRIAMEKYHKNKLCETPSEAVKMLFDHTHKVFRTHNLTGWRYKRYWNRECDQVYKHYMPVMKNIFKAYSGYK